MTSCNNSKNSSESSNETSIAGDYEVIFMAEIEDVDIKSKNISISFNEEGNVNGNNSCNNYGGDFKLENDKLSFDMMMTTRKICQENAEIETTCMRNLTEVDGYKIQEDVLVLLRGKTHVVEAKRILNTK